MDLVETLDDCFWDYCLPWVWVSGAVFEDGHFEGGSHCLAGTNAARLRILISGVP